ncbi:snRNA-activating protein complex subunit 5 [Notechis scutatus]|uniref:snRNA-activating protein complex subunit 5 n=1 Tax=Notechis scutatus TaxID=8663 RepID=A0A6J1UDC2_9SAUR|nr:snRNA-activating protein complex subunit 5 [Notechis scutatus]
MLSRLQELRKEEETLLRVKEALHDQLTRLKVEELALRSMINAREGTMFMPSAAVTEEHVNMDNELAINQTKLQLQVRGDGEEEEEEEEESDS